MKGPRACPVCAECGSRKFKVIKTEGRNALLECLKCRKKTKI